MFPQRKEIAEHVITAVEAVFGRSPDPATSLFDLPGFDSITIVAVLERLENELGVEVPAELIVPEAFESLDSLTDLLTSATPIPEVTR